MPHPREESEGLIALQALDVDHLAPVEHRDLDRLPGAVAQVLEKGGGCLMEVHVRSDERAQLVEPQAETVLARLWVLLDHVFGGKGDEKAVHGAFAKGEP